MFTSYSPIIIITRSNHTTGENSKMRPIGPAELKRILELKRNREALALKHSQKESVLSLLNESRTLEELESNMGKIGTQYASEQFSEEDLAEFREAYGSKQMTLQVSEFIRNIGFSDDIAALEQYYRDTVSPVMPSLSEDDALTVKYTYELRLLELEVKNNNAAALSDSSESEQLQKQLICEIKSSPELPQPTQSDADVKQKQLESGRKTRHANKESDRLVKKTHESKKPVTSPFFDRRTRPALVRINDNDYQPEEKKGCCVLS